MRGVGVSERVERRIFGEATLAHHALESLLEGGRRERHPLVSSGEQPGAGALALPVDPQQLQGPCGQGSQAVFPPVALSDTAQHAVGVKVRDLERGPLPQAQATGIDHPQTHRSFGVDDQGQPRADFLGTQHDREFSAGPGPNERQHRPGSL
jgi:hypothetical protein